MYARIVFMQDYDGPALSQPEQVFEYLQQWDYGDGYDIHDSPAYGAVDDVYRFGDYILSINRPLNYAGLELELD